MQRDIATSGEKPYSFTRFACAVFDLEGTSQSLDLYWLDGVRWRRLSLFRRRDQRRRELFGRPLLLDTVKGSDLGEDAGQLVLDFNFAYNPSCSYDPRWVCPLAPPGNRLDIPVRGGERQPAANPR